MWLVAADNYAANLEIPVGLAGLLLLKWKQLLLGLRTTWIGAWRTLGC